MYYLKKEGIVTIPLIHWEEWNRKITELEANKESIDTLKMAAIQGSGLIYSYSSASSMPWWTIYSKEKLDDLINEEYIQLKSDYSKLFDKSFLLEKENRGLYTEIEKYKSEIARLKSITPVIIGFWEWVKSKFRL